MSGARPARAVLPHPVATVMRIGRILKSNDAGWAIGSSAPPAPQTPNGEMAAR